MKSPKHKNVSVYGKSIMASRESQGSNINQRLLSDLQQLMLFDIEATDEGLEMNWFTDPMFGDSQIIMPRGTCEDCGNSFNEYRVTRSKVWFEVAAWSTVLCLECLVNRALAAQAFLGENLWKELTGL